MFFWAAHEKSFGGALPDDFKSMVQSMLNPSFSSRPSLDALQEFSWYMQETYTNDELFQVLAQPNQGSMKKRFKGLKAKIFTNKNSGSRSLDDDGLPFESPQPVNFFQASPMQPEEEDVFAAWNKAEERAPVYQAGDVAVYTSFLSAAKPSTLINALVNILEASKCQYTQSNFEVSCTVRYFDGNEVAFVVGAFQHREQDLRIVEFKRVGGSALLFNDLFNQLGSQMAYLIYEVEE